MSNERLAETVLLLARRLAYEHQRRILGADAEHDRGAGRVELASRALPQICPNLSQPTQRDAGRHGFTAGGPR